MNASSASASTPRLRILGMLDDAGPFLGLLLVLLLFSLNSEVRPVLYSGGNLKIILTQTVIVAIGALGMTMIIVSGGIDLSVGSAIALTSVIGAILVLKGWPTVAIILTTVLAGGAIGLANGAMVAGFRVTPFIVTLGMMGVLRGMAKWFANNQGVYIPGTAPVNRLMAMTSSSTLWPLPIGVWIAIVFAVLVSVIMRRTVFGRYIFAIGSNEAAARLSGINVPLQKILIYTVAGSLFGLAGLLMLSRLTVGDPTVAIGLELDIIAAVVIGGASLNGGTGSVLGSMIGALIMAVLRNGANQMGWQNFTQEIIIGLVIILAVVLDNFRQRRVRG